jgi:hypothetical protein
MPQRALHALGGNVARLDDCDLSSQSFVQSRSQGRERGRRERESPDSGRKEGRQPGHGGLRIERPLLDVDRGRPALAAQGLPERARPHAALDDDRRHDAAVAGSAGLRDRRLEAHDRDPPFRLHCERVDDGLRRGDDEDLCAVSAQLAEQTVDAPHDDLGAPARVRRVGVVAEQQHVFPGQQALQGACDRYPVGVLGQDADGPVRRQARGRVFSGS